MFADVPLVLKSSSGSQALLDCGPRWGARAITSLPSIGQAQEKRQAGPLPILVFFFGEGFSTSGNENVRNWRRSEEIGPQNTSVYRIKQNRRVSEDIVLKWSGHLRGGLGKKTS